MKIHYLTNKIAWFGKYSGYECLSNYLPAGNQIKLYASKSGFINKVFGKVFQLLYKWQFKRPSDVFAEVQFLQKIKSADISHVLYLDYHVHIISKVKANAPVTGTIHIPFSYWKEENLQLLPKLKNYIILYDRDVEKFQAYAPDSKFHVIKHGVDISFFSPRNDLQVKRNKVLFVGHYLRNFEMFYNTYNAISEKTSDDLEYHFIIPAINRKHQWLVDIADKPNVFFHEKLSDEELLMHYQDSYLLMMPMQESGANTAIVQAIAVGLPILTTDIGGIRSYGGGSVFPIVDNNDTNALTDLFFKYYNDSNYRNEISLKQRQFAVNELDWDKIAKQHTDLYQQLLS